MRADRGDERGAGQGEGILHQCHRPCPDSGVDQIDQGEASGGRGS